MSKFVTETYGGFGIDFLNDFTGSELWKRLKSNHLFLNIYDFWSIRRHGYLIDNYYQKSSTFKKVIRDKLRGNEVLPTYKVLIRMCANAKEDFNATEFLEGDWEQYFENLRNWKLFYEKDYLKMKLHLKEPKRHLKSKVIVIN